MTGQRRHYAARAEAPNRPDAGLPAPGQALFGHHPEPSLFGVPQRSAPPLGVPQQTRNGETRSDWSILPVSPRPRTPQDRPAAPRQPRRRRNWARLLGPPLAVVALGVALGVIAIVMLVAAGAPAPWASSAADFSPPPAPRPATVAPEPATAIPPAPEVAAAIPPAPEVADRSRNATGIVGDGLYLVGRDLEPGRYLTTAGQVNCHWARLRTSADGVRRVVDTGTASRKGVRIKASDAAFETTGCHAWIRR
jgi:hypothetical protein